MKTATKQTPALLSAISMLPTEIRNAIGAASISGIRSIVHATRANGDRVLNIRRSGVNGREQWVAGPAASSSWRCEGAKTRIRMA